MPHGWGSADAQRFVHSRPHSIFQLFLFLRQLSRRKLRCLGTFSWGGGESRRRSGLQL